MPATGCRTSSSRISGSRPSRPSPPSPRSRPRRRSRKRRPRRPRPPSSSSASRRSPHPRRAGRTALRTLAALAALRTLAALAALRAVTPLAALTPATAFSAVLGRLSFPCSRPCSRVSSLPSACLAGLDSAGAVSVGVPASSAPIRERRHVGRIPDAGGCAGRPARSHRTPTSHLRREMPVPRLRCGSRRAPCAAPGLRGGGRSGSRRGCAAALTLLDRGDQVALAHTRGALDAEFAGERTQLGEHHSGQAGTAPASARLVDAATAPSRTPRRKSVQNCPPWHPRTLPGILEQAWQSGPYRSTEVLSFPRSRCAKSRVRPAIQLTD